MNQIIWDNISNSALIYCVSVGRLISLSLNFCIWDVDLITPALYIHWLGVLLIWRTHNGVIFFIYFISTYLQNKMFTLLVWSWYMHTIHFNSFLNPPSFPSITPPSICWSSSHLKKIYLLSYCYLFFYFSLFIFIYNLGFLYKRNHVIFSLACLIYFA